MPLQPMYYAPGVCKTSSPYSSGKVVEYGEGRIAQGRYTDCVNTRFTAGFPEKLRGWVAANVSGLPAISGIPRAVKNWNDNNDSNFITSCVATTTNLFVYTSDETLDYGFLSDVTPTQVTRTQAGTNNFATTSGSSTVVITLIGAVYQNVGDIVFITSTAAVGGLTLNGWYPIVAIGSLPSTSVSINAGAQATSTVGGGGGTTSFGSTSFGGDNILSTTSGSATVTISINNHGLSAGNLLAPIAQYTVGGVTLNGTYPITVVDVNTVSIQAATKATSTVSSGGGQVAFYLLLTNTTTGVGSQWTLAEYGDQMLACPNGGTIYVITSANSRATPLANAPATISAMFVTPERFVTALGIGTGPDATQLAWADQSDYTDWTSTVTNTANSGRTLQGGSMFVGGIGVRTGVSLIWTDKTCFQMSYSGDYLVYDTPITGDNCGLIGPNAATSIGETAYWMSSSDFWMWNGTPQQLPSDDIREFVFSNINTANQSKCWAMSINGRREIWFFYPTGTSTECNAYVIYHSDQQCWSVGTMDRTCGTDQFIFSCPIMWSAEGVMYYHETGVDAAGTAMDTSITAAPVDLSNGDQSMNVFGFIPDFERLVGNISVSVLSQYFPNDPITTDGPYVLTDVNNGATRLDLRTDGKLIGFKLESNVLGGDYRLGLPRADTQPGGARR